MSHDASDLVKGTLELLILKTLSLEPLHGFGISQRIKRMSHDVFEVNDGSLYPALRRMKRKGWLRSKWQRTENNRRAKYYMLTPAGERRLAREREQWERASAAVDWILNWSGAPA